MNRRSELPSPTRTDFLALRKEFQKFDFPGIKRQILVIRNPRLDKAERGEEHVSAMDS